MQNFDEFFQRRSKVMLQFSAGKDSAACLYLLRNWWDRLDVVWMNPGNPTQETRAYMTRIAAAVPSFKEIVGGQPEWIRQYGYPVDILPRTSSQIGLLCEASPRPRFSSFANCCWDNMWLPMARAIITGGYTGVIRGQKLSDNLKIPMASGTVADGVEYLFPLEHWSDEDVFKFLGPGLTPPSYKRGMRSSLDCRNCTAYVKEHAGWVEDLEDSEPGAAAEVKAVHKELSDQLSSYVNLLKGW